MKNLPVKAGAFELNRYDLKRQNNRILHEPISAIAGSIALFFSSSAVYGVAIGGMVYGVSGAFLGSVALSIGTNLLSSMFTGSPKLAQTSLSRSPHLVNTHDTDEVVMPSYGEFRKGCNWVFADESGGHNKYLNLVLTWAEGLCNGLIYTTDYKANYSGSGKNDIRIKGTFSGAATREFKVQIDGTGSPNTFKWSVNNGSSWVESTVAMTANWDTLQEGVQIKFGATTGHTSGDSWTWMAGLGLWVGESLLGLFEAFGASDKDLADHYWHNGSKTQTVDTNLQTECPLYADANARTCYSYLRLKYNIQAFPSGVQDFFALAKWRHLFDPREVAHSSTDETTWTYSNNAALVALDWVIRRFGMDRPWARVDETSVEAAANWCDTNTMIFNGAILDEQSPEDTLRDIELCYRGFHFERDSKLVFGTFADDTAVMTFTEDDVMIDPEGFVIEIPGMPETPDRVVAWYQEPIENYAAKQVYYPQDNSLASDTGINEMELNLIGVTSRTKATQLAKYHYLRAVYNKTYSLTLSPRSYALEPGDMITVTHTFPGWSATKVRVLGFGVQQDNGWFTFNVIQENSAIYNTDVNVSDDDIFIEPGVYTYPPDIATGSVTAKGDGFKIFITAPEEIDITGYVVYVFTANTVASSVVIKRISGHPSSDTIHLGTVSETGGITLTTAVPYFFWVTALDENGHESLNKFYLGTATSGISDLVDTTAPTAPSDVVLSMSSMRGNKNKQFCKWSIDSFTPGTDTNLAGHIVEIYDHSGDTLITQVTIKKNATTAKGEALPMFTDADVPIEYYAIMIAFDKTPNYSTPSAESNHVTPGTAPIAQPITLSGITALWQFDGPSTSGDTTGSFVDVFGRSPTVVEATVHFATGKYGKGVMIDGTQYLTYSSSFFNAEKGKIIFWYVPDDNTPYAGDRVLFDFRDGTHANSPCLYIPTSTSNLIFMVNTASLLTAAITSTAGTPILIEISYDLTADLYAMYVNGVSVATSVSAQAQPSIADTFYVGSKYNSTKQARGVIDDLCFSSQVGNDSEALAIYQSGAPLQWEGSNLEDKDPPIPNPPTGMANDTPVKQHEDEATKYQCRIYWTACTDTSGSPVKYYVQHWTSASSDTHVYDTRDTQYTLKNLEYGVTHYWTIRAEDKHKNSTSPCATQSFAIGDLTPIEFLREFNSPWKQKTLAHSKKTTVDTPLSPAAGKIWQLLSYRLKAGTEVTYNLASLMINGTFYDGVQTLSDPNDKKVNQEHTAGIYLGSSDTIEIEIGSGSTPAPENMFRVAEYDVVDNVILFSAELNLTTYYEVTDGKKFVLTHAYSSFYATDPDLEVSFDGGSTYQPVVFNTYSNRETSGDGVFIFPDTAKFRSSVSGGIIHIFGYEMDP